MSDENKTLVIFGEALAVTPPMGWDVEYETNEDQLLSRRGIICLINVPSLEQDSLLKKIHGSEFGWSWRLYAVQASTLSPYLSDGVYESDQIRGVPEKLSYLSEQPSDTLLAYLWLDERRALKPIRDAGTTAIYRYPLIDAYYQLERTPFRYILKQVEQELLEKGECIDRVRYCQKCHSGHLNYVDACPSCSSVDTVSNDALHCFTCGNVDDAKNFAKHNALQCPNCSTLLKHIGVDYDRPLELMQCNSCQNEFAEARVIARCLSCGHKNNVESLITQTYFNYLSGDRAHLFLLNQASSKVSFRLSGTVDPVLFESVVSWKNQLSIRHSHTDLLIGLKIINIEEFIQKFGEVAYVEFLAQLSEQLESLFRTTDLSCQYSEEVLFVFLPICDTNSIEILRERLSEFATKIESNEIGLRVRHWYLPDQEFDDQNTWFKAKASELDA
ncbi:diguanylate cyclase [Vibrio breoganii]|uniref:TackOD1 domain-containing metal-binding protein n=1 Tax=Vibrio breoganii TaxID=553239 RepID=UPI000C85BEF3|nr:diguanylate cyclase [Vibrio breoganii]PMK50659.1 hypothetical protein BCU00_04290 [Vibrio breoganii]